MVLPSADRFHLRFRRAERHRLDRQETWATTGFCFRSRSAFRPITRSNSSIYFVGFLAVMAAAAWDLRVVDLPAFTRRPLTYCAIVFLSLGGIAFFISSLFRFDWPILAGVFLGSAILSYDLGETARDGGSS